MIEAAAAARYFSQYAKPYQAGAFGTPMRVELQLAQQKGLLHQYGEENPAALVLEQVSLNVLSLSDFTGRKIELPPGTRVARHVALGNPNGQLPDFKEFSAVCAYMEDGQLVAALLAQGFNLFGVKISAASEIIGIWYQGEAKLYAPWDEATVVELPIDISAKLRKGILAELKAITGWRDDDPYYHKGEWSHVSLRGYKPDDPHWGVKPSEMSKNWLAEHPEAKRLTKPDWTVLSKQTPALMALINSVKWWKRFDRVRLLRLTTGRLKRHTDITDRDAGTRDGKLCRFHLPLVTHPSVTTTAWDLNGRPLESHWDEWRLYYLDQRKPHAVANPSKVVRIHLVLDVVADSEVREHIAASVAPHSRSD
jgi:hypothetical protein